MNLMHNSLQITDGIYGIFSSHDIKSRILKMGSNENQWNSEVNVIRILENTLQELKSK
jgi:hypothetical protein